MTKRFELSILDRTIAELGDASYLGPWLRAVRAEVEADVVRDVEPLTLPSTAVEQSVAKIAHAQQRAAEIIAQAERKAGELMRVASDDSERIRGYAALALRGALATLEGRKP